MSQEGGPVRRLKWGTASLIARAPVTPIVLPIVHQGLQEVKLQVILGMCHVFFEGVLALDLFTCLMDGYHSYRGYGHE